VSEQRANHDFWTSSALANRMIFVVGARRSGTLWVERILTAHPDVRALPSETHLFSHGIRPLADRISHGILATPEVGALYMERRSFVAATRALCDAVMVPFLGPNPSPEARLLERSPWHVYHLDLIGALYPDAKVVHIVRDGRSVVRSLLAQSWGPSTVDAAAREWVGAIEATRRAAPQLTAYKELRYEQLFDQRDAGIADLYEWLGLACDPRHLDAALTEANQQNNLDVTTPWITADKWRGLLTPQQLDEFNAVAADTLAQLGYEPVASSDLEVPATTDKTVRRRRGRQDSAKGRAAGATERQQQLATMKEALRTMNQFLSLIGEGAYHRFGELLAPDVEITVSDGNERTTVGDRAIEEFAAALAADEPARARQLQGEVFADGSTVTVVQVHEGVDGAMSTRTLVATIRADRIRRLAYFRFPSTISESD